MHEHECLGCFESHTCTRDHRLEGYHNYNGPSILFCPRCWAGRRALLETLTIPPTGGNRHEP